jgi:hypothetical protein
MKRKSHANIVTLAGDDRWMVERDLETMIECKKIEADPKRLAKVRALAKEKMMAVAKVAAEGSDD